ncbi:MAG TPA: 5'-nucleotidase C-terminal domain-containing protein [Pyrinomonadaceae bacterium]|nr:5'-nucleotidase C-terminal domain-containing protein [Pyrinomonadaceae bacterium]
MNTRLRNSWRFLLLLSCLAAFPVQSTLAQQKSQSRNRPCPKTPCISRTGETLVDAKIPDDAAVERMLKPYAGKVRALNVVIGKLEGELRKGGIGAGSLGNFATDAIRSQASAKQGRVVPIAITNSGGLRKNTIAEGELRASDIFELMPFENSLVQIELTGEQLLKVLTVVLESRDAQSGAKIQYRMNGDKPELISAKLIDSQGREIDIDPRGTYSLVTIDYLLNLASGRYTILQQGKNPTPLGITLRDATMNYVKAETAAGRPIKATLDGRFVNVNPEGQPQ